MDWLHYGAWGIVVILLVVAVLFVHYISKSIDQKVEKQLRETQEQYIEILRKVGSDKSELATILELRKILTDINDRDQMLALRAYAKEREAKVSDFAPMAAIISVTTVMGTVIAGILKYLIPNSNLSIIVGAIIVTSIFVSLTTTIINYSVSKGSTAAMLELIDQRLFEIDTPNQC